MTPEERANKLVQDFRDAKEVGLDLRPAIAAAIRAAEQEAVEQERLEIVAKAEELVRGFRKHPSDYPGGELAALISQTNLARSKGATT